MAINIDSSSSQLKIILKTLILLLCISTICISFIAIRSAQMAPTRLLYKRELGTPRIVAIGDLHGDITNAIKTFKMAGLIDDTQNWVANDTIFVQTVLSID